MAKRKVSSYGTGALFDPETKNEPEISKTNVRFTGDIEYCPEWKEEDLSTPATADMGWTIGDRCLRYLRAVKKIRDTSKQTK